MHYKKFYLSPLAACVALTMSSSLQAAEPIFLQDASFQSLQQQFHFILPGTKPAPTADALNSLQFLQQHTSKNRITHIRMQQTYAGFMVYGGYAIMHSSQPAKLLLSGSNKEVKMTGKVYQGLSEELGQPANDFVKNGSQALQQFKNQYKDHALSEEHVSPLVYIDEKNQPHWGYKVSVLVTYTDKIPARPTAIIDANTYKPFIQWNDIKTAVVPVKGKGYGGNEKTGQFDYEGTKLPYLKINRDKAAKKCYMENTDTKVVHLQHKYSGENVPMSFACKLPAKPGVFWTNGAGYDKENGAFSPTNDALYAGEVIRHLYLDWYDLNVLHDPQDESKPLQLIMRTHYGSGYENAFWDGKQMTFGDGADYLYPLTSLDVGAHEISHGFTEQNSNLYYYQQSGGMNEAFSDIAAQASFFYARGSVDWLIGGEIMKTEEALRYMDKPSKDGISIDTADQYSDDLDVHYSSGVYNHLYYLLSTQPGWDPHKAFDVMVGANVDYWTPNSTFVEGGCGLLHAAQDLNYPIQDVKTALDGVKINYETCKL